MNADKHDDVIITDDSWRQLRVGTLALMGFSHCERRASELMLMCYVSQITPSHYHFVLWFLDSNATMWPNYVLTTASVQTCVFAIIDKSLCVEST